MRVCVVIPNDDWRGAAGVRIRYDRMRPYLNSCGVEFELESLESVLAAQSLSADIYLLSKCHDARSVVLVQRAKDAGRRVGIDIFDDYYSDSKDSSFTHLYRWFQTLAARADFALCATPRMQQRLEQLAPQLPCHVMNDPAPAWDQDRISQSLRDTQRHFTATGEFQVGWFGIGDNPYFQLGLDDLTRFGYQLGACRHAGLTPRLSILTNRRAMTVERLEALARLPISYALEEWSEDRERHLIAKSLFCFLPVNGQRFSTVKSLNRAVSVLTGGAQVLSAGFPLYDALDSFIYRDLDTLLSDASAGQMRMRQETVPDLSNHLLTLGSAKVEAEAIVSFLSKIKAPAVKAAGKHTELLLLGHRSAAPVADQLSASGMLTAVTPRTPGRIKRDVKILPLIEKAGALRVRFEFSERAVHCLKPSWKKKILLGENGKPNRLDISEKDLGAVQIVLRPGLFTSLTMPVSLMRELERYDQDMECAQALLELVFLTPRITLSEDAAPFQYQIRNLA